MTLHLVRLPLDLGALAKAAGDRGWTRGGGSFDEGAALHHLLGETFGPAALQPFRVMLAPRAPRGRLYAYADAEPDALRALAARTAMPEIDLALSPASLEAKPMPAPPADGTRVGFDLRLRPVVRLARDHPAPDDRAGGRQHGFRKGAEVDAFLAEALHHADRGAMADAGRTREAVYRDWLSARLEVAAHVEEARLASVRRAKVARGGRAAEGPDIVMHGTLVVRDAAGFADLLRRGVGRHKAYGYGMLLLRPPGAPVPRS